MCSRLRRVDLVDHRRERGRLARAGRAGQEDDPALLVGEVLDHLGQAEVIDRAHLEGDRAADDRDVAALAEGVHAEAGDARHLVGEVGLADVAELGEEIRVVEDVLQRGVGVLGREGLGVRNGLEHAMDARHRLRGHLDVEVRALVLDHVAQGLIDVKSHH